MNTKLPHNFFIRSLYSQEIPLPAMYPVISKKAGIMTLMVCRADLSYIVRDFELGLPFQPLTLFYFIFILVFRRRPVKDSTLVIAVENGQGLPFQCGVIVRAC